MRPLSALRAALALSLFSAHGWADPVRYILDTDIASDCDDAGAVAMVNALADNGEVAVLAMMVSTGGDYGAPCLSAINIWYGRQDLPIGTLKNARFWVGGSMNAPSGWKNYESYNRYIAENFPTRIKSGKEAPDARELYRKILAAQPDRSVVINSIGPLINLCHLMQSGPDQHSPLNGKDLIRAKVKRLVIAGGRNPEGTSSNFSKEDAELYTKPVIDEWPGPVVFVGNDVGHAIKTGWSRNAEATKDNPARAAYRRFFAGNDQKKHHSADQAGILHAVRGLGSVFTLVENGHQTCAPDGTTKWVPSPAPDKKHAYLSKLEGKDAEIAAAIETLMTQSPKAGTSAK